MKKERKIKAPFKETKILPYTNKPEACLYLITNKTNGKKYEGVHKYKKSEYPGDGTYWHSSKNKEFISVCNNASSHLVYEILRYGSYDEMTYYESEDLKSVNAVSNDMWYNDSNGSPKFKPAQIEKIEKLRDEILLYSKSYGDLVDLDLIKDSPFEIYLEDKEVVYNMDSIQARQEMDTELIIYITAEVDKKMSINKCKPVIIVDDRVLDGHHTRAGVHRANKVDKIPVLLVDNSITKDWTETEKRILANLLNPKSEVRENEMSEKDAVKLLITYAVNDKVPVSFPGNVTTLEMMGFGSTEISRIINKATKEVARQTYSLNETHIHWGGEVWKTRMLDLISKVSDDSGDETLVTYTSTEALSMRALELVHEAFYSLDKKSFLQPTGKKVKELIIFAHAPTPDALTTYQNGEGDLFKSRLMLFLKDKGIKVNVILMPSTRPDTNVNPEAFWKTQQGQVWISDNNLEHLGLGDDK
jgi:hypothetical protein